RAEAGERGRTAVPGPGPARRLADLRGRRGEGSEVMNGLTRRRLLRIGRLATLALVLGLVALAIPDSSVKSTEFALVKVDQGGAVPLDPHVISVLAVGSDARP